MCSAMDCRMGCGAWPPGTGESPGKHDGADAAAPSVWNPLEEFTGNTIADGGTLRGNALPCAILPMPDAAGGDAL